jgi:hypothetical protein
VGHTTAKGLAAGVTSQKERTLQWKIRLRSCGTLAALPTANADLNEFVSYRHVFVLRKHVFWVVAPCGWVIYFPRFEVKYRLHLQGYEFVNSLIILKMKAVLLFETSGSNYQTTRQKDVEGLVTQQSLRGNLKSLFLYC